MMKKLGLIGYSLSHSFSKKYFENKFQQEKIEGYQYDLYELESIEGFNDLITQNSALVGLNVTIPYKEQVIPYLDTLSSEAQKIGAVNVIKIEENGQKVGYNSDYFGFRQSLVNTSWNLTNIQALVLGTGGASKAVQIALQDLNIPYQIVSRKPSSHGLVYEDLTEKFIQDFHLIINTTPLGMSPKIETYPDLPYTFIHENHLFFDLVYNPEKTIFLRKGETQGVKTQNGLEMLHLQAEKAWEIWTKKSQDNS